MLGVQVYTLHLDDQYIFKYIFVMYLLGKNVD